MGYVELISALLGVIDKVIDKIPNYEQRKKDKYYKLKKEYFEVINSENIDHNLADKLALELRLFIDSFGNEISK